MGKSMGPSGMGRDSFVEIGPKTRRYRRVLLSDTCRIPWSFHLLPRIVRHIEDAHASTTSARPRRNLGTEDRPLGLHHAPHTRAFTCRGRSQSSILSADINIHKCIDTKRGMEKTCRQDNHRRREQQSI